MSASGPSGKPSFMKRRYLLDRPSQVSVTWYLVSVLAGIGALYAVAVYVLLGSELMGDKSPGEMRRIMLGVQAGYFLVGGAILAVTALLLTHRYVGPAFVMRRAVRAMREADYSCRLNLRQRDYHKPLAAELTLLRDELAAREAARTRLLRDLERNLDDGDDAAVRTVLAQLLDTAGAPALPSAERAEVIPVGDSA